MVVGKQVWSYVGKGTFILYNISLSYYVPVQSSSGHSWTRVRMEFAVVGDAASHQNSRRWPQTSWLG